MPDDERKAKRGPDGKFLPGHKPPRSPGRPRGPNGIKARAARLATEQLEEMLERATEIIAEELEDGNPAIAQWIIDRVRPPGRSDYVQFADSAKLDTFEEIVATSAHVAGSASAGQISLQQARYLQDILGRHVQFKGLEELIALRSEVEKLKDERSSRPRIGRPEMPKWGRLSDEDQNLTKKGNE